MPAVCQAPLQLQGLSSELTKAHALRGHMLRREEAEDAHVDTHHRRGGDECCRGRLGESERAGGRECFPEEGAFVPGLQVESYRHVPS